MHDYVTPTTDDQRTNISEIRTHFHFHATISVKATNETQVNKGENLIVTLHIP